MSKPKNRRTPAQKERRRQRERGPWPCSLCDRPPFQSVSGLRDHVVLEHRRRSSWTGQIRHFKSQEDEQQAVDKVLGYRRHATRNRCRPEPAVNQQPSMPDADIGNSSKEPINGEVDIDLDDMAADAFNLVAAIKSIHSYEEDFILGNDAVPDICDVNIMLPDAVTSMDFLAALNDVDLDVFIEADVAGNLTLATDIQPPLNDAAAETADTINETSVAGILPPVNDNSNVYSGNPPSLDNTASGTTADVNGASSTPTDEPGRSYNVATQTSQDATLSLLDGVTLERLARMMFESPGTSVADQVYALGRNLPSTVSMAMHGMDIMARTIIGFLADQRKSGRTSEAAAYQARLTVLHQQLSSLWNRSTDSHPPIEGKCPLSPPVEEVTKSPPSFNEAGGGATPTYAPSASPADITVVASVAALTASGASARSSGSETLKSPALMRSE